jgi:hypothetical protein
MKNKHFSAYARARVEELTPGTLVRRHPIIGEAHDGKLWPVRSVGKIPSSKEPVVWLEGFSGCMCISAISMPDPSELPPAQNGPGRHAVTYACGTEHKPGEFGMWWGPVETEEEALATQGGMTTDAVIRFNTDGTDTVLHRWDVTQWKWVPADFAPDVVKEAIGVTVGNPAGIVRAEFVQSADGQGTTAFNEGALEKVSFGPGDRKPATGLASLDAWLDPEDHQGMTSLLLDDIVHDAASRMASNANNDGLSSQLEFLRVTACWTDDDILNALNDAVSSEKEEGL